MQKRVVPVGAAAAAVLFLIGGFEMFIIVGGLEIDAQTLREKAPWFAGPFLKWVGEDPDHPPKWFVEEPPVSAGPSVADLVPEAVVDPVPLNTPTNPAPDQIEVPAVAEKEIAPAGQTRPGIGGMPMGLRMVGFGLRPPPVFWNPDLRNH